MDPVLQFWAGCGVVGLLAAAAKVGYDRYRRSGSLVNPIVDFSKKFHIFGSRPKIPETSTHSAIDAVPSGELPLSPSGERFMRELEQMGSGQEPEPVAENISVSNVSAAIGTVWFKKRPNQFVERVDVCQNPIGVPYIARLNKHGFASPVVYPDLPDFPVNYIRIFVRGDEPRLFQRDGFKFKEISFVRPQQPDSDLTKSGRCSIKTLSAKLREHFFQSVLSLQLEATGNAKVKRIEFRRATKHDDLIQPQTIHKRSETRFDVYFQKDAAISHISVYTCQDKEPYTFVKDASHQTRWSLIGRPNKKKTTKDPAIEIVDTTFPSDYKAAFKLKLGDGVKVSECHLREHLCGNDLPASCSIDNSGGEVTVMCSDIVDNPRATYVIFTDNSSKRHFFIRSNVGWSHCPQEPGHMVEVEAVELGAPHSSLESRSLRLRLKKAKNVLVRSVLISYSGGSSFEASTGPLGFVDFLTFVVPKSVERIESVAINTSYRENPFVFYPLGDQWVRRQDRIRHEVKNGVLNNDIAAVTVLSVHVEENPDVQKCKAIASLQINNRYKVTKVWFLGPGFHSAAHELGSTSLANWNRSQVQGVRVLVEKKGSKKFEPTAYTFRNVDGLWVEESQIVQKADSPYEILSAYLKAGFLELEIKGSLLASPLKKLVLDVGTKIEWSGAHLRENKMVLDLDYYGQGTYDLRKATIELHPVDGLTNFVYAYSPDEHRWFLYDKLERVAEKPLQPVFIPKALQRTAEELEKLRPLPAKMPFQIAEACIRGGTHVYVKFLRHGSQAKLRQVKIQLSGAGRNTGALNFSELNFGQTTTRERFSHEFFVGESDDESRQVESILLFTDLRLEPYLFRKIGTKWVHVVSNNKPWAVIPVKSPDAIRIGTTRFNTARESLDIEVRQPAKPVNIRQITVWFSDGSRGTTNIPIQELQSLSWFRIHLNPAADQFAKVTDIELETSLGPEPIRFMLSPNGNWVECKWEHLLAKKF